jgi:hypothetical protein
MKEIVAFKTFDGLTQAIIPAGTFLKVSGILNNEIIKQAKDVVDYTDGDKLLYFHKNSSILVTSININKRSCNGLFFITACTNHMVRAKVKRSFRHKCISMILRYRKTVLVPSGHAPIVSQNEVCVQAVGSKNRFYIMSKKSFDRATFIFDTKRSIKATIKTKIEKEKKKMQQKALVS